MTRPEMSFWSPRKKYKMEVLNSNWKSDETRWNKTKFKMSFWVTLWILNDIYLIWSLWIFPRFFFPVFATAECSVRGCLQCLHGHHAMLGLGPLRRFSGGWRCSEDLGSSETWKNHGDIMGQMWNHNKTHRVLIQYADYITGSNSHYIQWYCKLTKISGSIFLRRKSCPCGLWLLWLIQWAQVVRVPPLLELPWTSVALPRSGCWDWARMEWRDVG